MPGTSRPASRFLHGAPYACPDPPTFPRLRMRQLSGKLQRGFLTLELLIGLAVVASITAVVGSQKVIDEAEAAVADGVGVYLTTSASRSPSTRSPTSRNWRKGSRWWDSPTR